MTRGKDLKVRKRRCDRHQDNDLLNCVDCGLARVRFRLSKAGLCMSCSVRRQIRCLEQLRAKRGEIYERWQRNRELAKIGMKGGING